MAGVIRDSIPDMKIDITRVKRGHYRADCLDLPGSPPCGDGKTELMALAALMYQLIFDRAWQDYIKYGEPITINGKAWKNPFRNAGRRADPQHPVLAVLPARAGW